MARKRKGFGSRVARTYVNEMKGFGRPIRRAAKGWGRAAASFGKVMLTPRRRRR